MVGVMPKGFAFPGGRSSDLWLPATLNPGAKEDFTTSYLMLVGRLKKGVTIAQAQSELVGIARGIRQQRPNLPATYGENARIGSLQTEMVGDMRTTLFILLGTVGVLLLIACANVANLQLARTSTRQREFAVRAALGASRARLVRQLLTESCLLSLLGGFAGIGMAWIGLDLLLALAPAETPRLSEIAISRPVLFFSLGLALLAGVLFGLAPAFQISRPDLQAPLKDGGRVAAHGLGGRRLRSSLVVLEIALALMLVTSAGLLIKSFWRLHQIDPGFSAEQVLSFQLSPPDFGEEDSAPRARTYYRQVLERLRALPGVQSVGGIHLLPMSDSNWDPGLRIEDRPLPPGSSHGTVNWRLVTSDYFATMKIPLLRGRSFGASDDESGEKVALINASLARKYWPGEDPIGKRIGSGFEGKGNWVTVVGVVGDIKQHGLGLETRPEMYRPYFQHTSLPPMTLMVRTNSAPAALASSIRSAVWSIDKNVPITDLQPMTEVVAHSIAQPRSTMLLLSVFAGIGLTLGIIGIYGVISYSVAQRTQEIGVRMALGARTSDVLRLIVGQGLKLTLLGVVAGVGGALAVTRLMSSLLFGVSATDPTTFVAIAAALTLVALFACYLPARRATRISPVTALRYE